MLELVKVNDIFEVLNQVWQCDCVTVQQCDSVTVWQCDSVTEWQCDSMTVTQCDSMKVRQWDSETVWRWHSVTVCRLGWHGVQAQGSPPNRSGRTGSDCWPEILVTVAGGVSLLVCGRSHCLEVVGRGGHGQGGQIQIPGHGYSPCPARWGGGRGGEEQTVIPG